MYPGWCGLGGYWLGAIPGTHPARPEAGLTLIYGILEYNRFILPFDWNILYIILNLALDQDLALDLALDLDLVLDLDLRPRPQTGLRLVLRSTSKNLIS